MAHPVEPCGLITAYLVFGCTLPCNMGGAIENVSLGICRQQIQKKIRKIEQAELVENQVTYPTDFCIICILFSMGKSENT